MAEFQEVIKHWGRMLDSHKHGESIAIEASVPADAFKDAKLVEEIVMSWAAEHPEPVYPTWGEWLAEQGELCKNWKDIRVISSAGNSASGVIGWFYKNIPADIAQKLGVKPKEGA